jgi:hypothetical protein
MKCCEYGPSFLMADEGKSFITRTPEFFHWKSPGLNAKRKTLLKERASQSSRFVTQTSRFRHAKTGSCCSSSEECEKINKNIVVENRNYENTYKDYL